MRHQAPSSEHRTAPASPHKLGISLAYFPVYSAPSSLAATASMQRPSNRQPADSLLFRLGGALVACLGGFAGGKLAGVHEERLYHVGQRAASEHLEHLSTQRELSLSLFQEWGQKSGKDSPASSVNFGAILLARCGGPALLLSGRPPETSFWMEKAEKRRR